MNLAQYNTETLWLMAFLCLMALGLISLTCLGWHWVNQIRDLNHARTEVERENAWISRLNQGMRQFLITKGLVDEFKAEMYKLYSPVPVLAPTLKDVEEELLSHIEATKPLDSEVSDVIVLPPERKEPNGSVPAVGPVLH